VDKPGLQEKFQASEDWWEINKPRKKIIYLEKLGTCTE
jgi:hypothetical protein